MVIFNSYVKFPGGNGSIVPYSLHLIVFISKLRQDSYPGHGDSTVKSKSAESAMAINSRGQAPSQRFFTTGRALASGKAWNVPESQAITENHRETEDWID